MASILATTLDNSVIGGPDDSQNGIRFQAIYDSPLAALRCYVIDNDPAGYSMGRGGILFATLHSDINGQPGELLSSSRVMPDPQFPNPSSGRGKFPIIGFSALPTLVKGTWYWIVISNIAPDRAVDYFSMDYLMNKTRVNQVPSAEVYQSVNGGPFKLVPYLIPSPLVFYYANGLFQGLGWIAFENGALEPGTEYGFPAASSF